MRLATAAALAVDAYVHADLITRYAPNKGSAAISQGDLFRIEAAVSAFAALALILTARRVIWILAVLVAASALGGLLLYRYFNPGGLGPLPDMYEPSWYPEKTLTAVAETLAIATALVGWVIAPSATRRAITREGQPATAPARRVSCHAPWRQRNRGGTPDLAHGAMHTRAWPGHRSPRR